MAREDPQFRIRLPSDLKEAVEQAAALAQRSLNAEIVHRLQASFLNVPQLPDQKVAQTFRKLGMAILKVANSVEPMTVTVTISNPEDDHSEK